LAAILARELAAPPDAAEIGYPGGERVVFAPEMAPVAETDGSTAALPDDAVVLATGGARGITAELLRSLVKPGMTVILVGRSTLDADGAAAAAEPSDPALIRAQLIERNRLNGAQRRPAEIEQAVTAEMHRREAARTMAALRTLGVAVEYHALDVGNVDRFTALVADVYKRHGRIDVVLHGAGVIEDKALVDKTDASIDRVFDTKVDSAFALYRSLDPSTLKSIVFFTSLAGRFGNRGQVDYATANEVLNRLAWRMAVEWPQVRVLSINWGPWARIGMAVDALGTVGRRLAPVEPEAGCAFFGSELVQGRSGDVEVLAGDVAASPVEQPDTSEPGLRGRETSELVGAAGDS
jgi:NAD(P)-dependent dehydrogenase (short-subunit alcohol dehydrogenase family)